jgi:protein-disulfide isomerase
MSPYRNALFGIVAVGALAASPALAQGFSPAQSEEIAKIVRDTILKNPDILIEAMRLIEERQKLEADAAARKAIAESWRELRDDPDSAVGGNAKGDVTLVQFYDYKCGYCKRAHPAVVQLMKSDPKVRVVYKELPILGPESLIAARAAIAARKSDKFIKFHDALMTARGALDEPSVLQIASEVGLDAKRLKSDMAGEDVAKIVFRNRQLAEKLGINGTPAFVVGGQLIPGAIDLATMRQVVAEARKSCDVALC